MTTRFSLVWTLTVLLILTSGSFHKSPPGPSQNAEYHYSALTTFMEIGGSEIEGLKPIPTRRTGQTCLTLIMAVCLSVTGLLPIMGCGGPTNMEGNRPEISLIGENHRLHRDQLSFLIRAAHAGKIILLREGLIGDKTHEDAYKDQIDSKLGVSVEQFAYGIENEPQYLFWTMLDLYIQAHKNKNFMVEQARGFLVELQLNGMATRYWEKFEANVLNGSFQLDTRTTNLFQFISSLSVQGHSKKYSQFVDQVWRDPLPYADDYRSWSHIAFYMMRLMTEDPEFRSLASNEGINLNKLSALLENPLMASLQDSTNLYYAVGIDWRNRIFVRRIIQLVTFFHGQRKEIVLQIGSAHLPGIKAALSQQGIPFSVRERKGQYNEISLENLELRIISLVENMPYLSSP